MIAPGPMGAGGHEPGGGDDADALSGLVRLAPRVAVSPAVLRFTFVASPGPGGQNVNKRATKAVLRIRLEDLPLTPMQRARLERLASAQRTNEGELVISCDDTRSQGRNRDACVERLSSLVRAALVQPKVRRPTKPTRGSQERRIAEKKRRGDIKRDRRDQD